MAYGFKRHRVRVFLSVSSNVHEIPQLSFVLRENVCLRKWRQQNNAEYYTKCIPYQINYLFQD